MPGNDDNTASALLGDLMLDSDSQSARVDYCGVVSEQLTSVASWLAVDAWLGGGDASHSADDIPISHGRRDGFAAVALIVQFTSELTAGAVSEIRAERAYAAAALIRQLLECEYLLEVFRLDFEEAAKWYAASDTDLRKSFKVFDVRTIGGFSKEEYRTHCERGGHPHPRGAYLVQLPNQFNQIRAKDAERPAIDRTVDLWLDFAHHLQRIWALAVKLLRTEHARFAAVRADSVGRVAAEEKTWREVDELADPILRQRLIDLVRTAPDATIDDLA